MTVYATDINLHEDLFAQQWWFAQIYTSGFEGADPLIADVLPAMIAQVRPLGMQRWFFMRYLDDHGPHVRLRVLGNRAVQDRLQDSRHELRDQINAICAQPIRHEFITTVPRETYEGRLGTGSRGALYEPELTKYGGPSGVALAEELFEFSSELALWACGRFEKTTDRAALATLLLGDVADSLIHGPGAAPARHSPVDWDGYWDHHLR